MKRGKKEQVKYAEKRSGFFNLHLIVLIKTLHQRAFGRFLDFVHRKKRALNSCIAAPSPPKTFGYLWWFCWGRAPGCQTEVFPSLPHIKINFFKKRSASCSFLGSHSWIHPRFYLQILFGVFISLSLCHLFLSFPQSFTLTPRAKSAPPAH